MQKGKAMGAFMKEDDIYIGTFLDLFNIRFAPTPFSADAMTVYGGIDEMTALQGEFGIFSSKRPFSASAALLSAASTKPWQKTAGWSCFAIFPTTAISK
jgi:hypothetical protein